MKEKFFTKSTEVKKYELEINLDKAVINENLLNR